ncbi:MAG: endonuclease/exonuclease/phosphatase family protein [Bacteroidales bacterium]|nr:endonuclease/exonuclease/phosphatase family protein [Bacteroidales bacterium]
MKKTALFLALLIALLPAMTARADQPAQFNVATYNLRLLNRGDSIDGNGWQVRYRPLAALVDYHGFDIFGTQEGFRSQLDDLKAALPGYDYIGVGRDDGKQGGEHSAIFYRTDIFTLLDHGDFWLSETPEHPGLGWDAAYPRICSWGRFRHNASGKEFVMLNLHMDHIGRRARVESVRLLLSRSEIADGVTTFVTGDFNVDQTSEPYAEIISTGRLVDSYTAAKTVYAPNGTFNGFDPDGFTESRIDHIFVSPDVSVGKYGILTDTYRSAEGTEAIDGTEAPAEIDVRRYRARTPSDHYPVKINVTF